MNDETIGRHVIVNRIVNDGQCAVVDMIPLLYTFLQEVKGELNGCFNASFDAIEHRIDKVLADIGEAIKDPKYFDDDNANTYCDHHSELIHWLENLAPGGFFFGPNPFSEYDFGYWEKHVCPDCQEEE